MDLVPNHTSSAHPWFQAALAAGPGSDPRERYIFRDGTGSRRRASAEQLGVDLRRARRGRGSPSPTAIPGSGICTCSTPNSPTSTGRTARSTTISRRRCGSGWNAASTVSASTSRTAWPSRRGCPTWRSIEAEVLLADMDDDPRFNHDGVHDIHRHIRTVLNDYPHAVAIGEVWVYDNEQFSRYLRADELHLGFNFRLLRAEVRRGGHPRRDRELVGGRRDRGRDADVDAGQPRRRPRSHPLRRRRRRPGPRVGDGAGDARAAGCGVHLQRRGTRPGERRAARRGAARPGVGAIRAHPARPRRLAGCRCRGRATLRRSASPTIPTPGCRFRRSGRR